MKRKKTKRKQQGCDVAKVIDTVEQAVSTAKKVYRVIEPVVSAFTRTTENQVNAQTKAPVELTGALCFEEKLANLQSFPANCPLWRQK